MTTHTLTRVEHLENPSAAEFARFRKTGRPAVISSGLNGWPALSRWNPAYLRERAGAAKVPVIALPDHQPDGQFFYAGSNLFQMTKFRHCLDLLDGARPRVYLASVSLRDYLPTLAADLGPLPLLGAGRPQKPHLWISGAGSTGPLHYDLDDNIHALVAGRKGFLLYDYRQAPYLYPSPVLSNHPHLSRVDPDRPDLAHHPRFPQAQGQEVLLKAGEMIYIPTGCWHRVTTLEPCVAVNYWLQRHYFHPATLRIVLPLVPRLVLSLGRAAAGRLRPAAG